MSLTRLQGEMQVWLHNNFPATDSIQQFLGVVEEVGELAHSILKLDQGIRGDSHVAEAKDAVGDIAIFLLNFCNKQGWNFEEILNETWSEVRGRDWIAFPEAGTEDDE